MSTEAITYDTEPTGAEITEPKGPRPAEMKRPQEPLCIFHLANLTSRLITRTLIADTPHNKDSSLGKFLSSVNTDIRNFQSKTDFRRWCAKTTTDHKFISLVAGLDPGLRVTAANGANPAKIVHGFVFDYDHPIPGTADPLTELLARIDPAFLPTAVGCSYSGNIRTLYVFREPVVLPDPAIYAEFAKRFAVEAHATRAFHGIDDAYQKPSSYYEIGVNWTFTGQDFGPEFVETVLCKVISKPKALSRLVGDYAAPTIEHIRAVLADRYPGALTPPLRWETLAIGDRVNLFWLMDGVDRIGAQIFPEGIVVYSTRSTETFLPWSHSLLLGNTIRKAADEFIKDVVRGIYFDGQSGGIIYYRNSTNIGFQKVSRTQVVTELKMKGLKATAATPGTASQVDRAMHYIETRQSVAGSYPALYEPNAIVYRNGKAYLNSSEVEALAPHPDPNPTFGSGFPAIAKYLTQAYALCEDGEIYESPDDIKGQLCYLLAWLRHAYVPAATQHHIPRGLAVVIAGPADAGKTFFSRAIVSRLLGGYEDATRFVTGEDGFNDRLFLAPLWCLDDPPRPEKNKSSHDRYSQNIKTIIANDRLFMRGMRVSGYAVDWTGRIVITINSDPHSIQMLPRTDKNLVDKLSFFLVNSKPAGYIFPSDATLEVELPFFGAWLRDWTPPSECVSGCQRFGVKPYHHSTLMSTARANSETSGFYECIKILCEAYSQAYPNKKFIRGTAAEIVQIAYGFETVQRLFDKFGSVKAIGMQLRQLCNLEDSVITSELNRDKTHVYHIPLYRSHPNEHEDKRNDPPDTLTPF